MTLAFDANLSARTEATYRTPDVVAQRGTILDALDPRPAGLIGFIAGFVPGRADLTADDVEAWRTDLEILGLDYFCSVNRYLFLAIAS